MSSTIDGADVFDGTTATLMKWCIPQSLHEPSEGLGASDGIYPPSNLHASAISFIDALGLHNVHPHCSLSHNNTFGFGGEDNATVTMTYGADSMENCCSGDGGGRGGGLSFGRLESAATAYHQTMPTLFGLGELWLRLFAFYLAPICLAYLLHANVFRTTFAKGSSGVRSLLAAAVGFASCAVLTTDELYIYEFGGLYGLSFFALTFLIVGRTSYVASKSWDNLSFRSNGKIKAVTLMCAVVSLLAMAWVISFTLSCYSLGNPLEMCDSLDIPTIKAGFYFDASNPRIAAIASNWPEFSRSYETRASQSRQGGETLPLPTPWLVTGDSRTGIPFLVNSVEGPAYHRLWVPSAEDPGEAVALDVAFPPDGRHSRSRPIYLLLHGLNGGSNEQYVREFVSRETSRGSTVAVMVARGLMDTPVVGMNVFHAARVSDVDATARAIKNAAGRKQIVAGVGFSMGAIILSNYVARSGANCHLDAAAAVSGGLDMREQLDFPRGQRLWQPLLARTMRSIILGKARKRYESRLTSEQFHAFVRAPDLLSIDKHAMVPYHGFRDTRHYASEMSALGDHVSFDGAKEEVGRIANVSVPFCVIHALDDPLLTWRAVGNPPDVVKSGSGNTMILLTKSGGHVGWPLGLNPKNHGWSWMINAVTDFVASVNMVSEELSRDRN